MNVWENLNIMESLLIVVWIFTNSKKKHGLSNNTSDTSDLNAVRNIYFENSTNIENEIFSVKDTVKSEEQNEGNRGYVVDNEQIKNDTAVDELKYSSEGVQIKTESVSSDVQLRIDVKSENDDYGLGELQQRTETLQFELKMELDDFVLKEEQVLINDVIDDDDTQSLCNDNRVHIPEETNRNSTFGSR